MSRPDDGRKAKPASTLQHRLQRAPMAGERKGLGKVDFRKRAMLTGTIGLLVWIVIFGMGCLVDSTPYRIVNDPTFRRQILLKADKSGQDSEIPDAQIIRRAKELDSDRNVHLWTRMYSFGLALLTFTPINLGILCFLSGLMGGCSSQATYRRLLHDKKVPDPADGTATQASSTEQPTKTQWSENRLFYMSEQPITAAMRSFVVYLFLLAGIYLAAGDPFKDLNASQYLRMVGFVSSIAFAVGYDPTRFTELLNYIPKPGGAKP